MAIRNARFHHALAPAAHLRAGGLWVVAAGVQDKHGDHDCFIAASTAQPALIRIAAGSGLFAIDGGSPVAMPIGSIALLMPGHRYSYGPASRCREQWVLFEGPLIDAFIAAGVLDPLRPVRRPRDPRIAAAWRRMLRGFADGPAHGPAIATTALLEILHRVARDTGGGDRRAGPDLADLATARIHAAPERSWTAHRLATELGVSVHRLRRAFAAATGGGITAYVLAERVRRARIVLSQGLSVAQAATSCGFADPAYFARVVCRLSGRPPSHWRPSRGRDQRAGG